MAARLPKLPELLDRKIYKTGQTRGADDDVIYQNRVGRNSTVLIPFQFWPGDFQLHNNEQGFEKGFIVLIPPAEYFAHPDIDARLQALGLAVGQNALVFYETRQEWLLNNPETLGWTPANSRTAPLGGNYAARIPATTAIEGGGKIIRGFTATSMKGAGIRLYEYASLPTINAGRLQLEALFWHCADAVEVAAQNGMTEKGARDRKAAILEQCERYDLLDYAALRRSRIINAEQTTVCPLCLLPLAGAGFFNKVAQAEGRVVPDLTVTEVNLFHIQELRYGVFNHRPYNLGWGHHHCNVVTKDSGIEGTIIWMKEVLARNEGVPVPD